MSPAVMPLPPAAIKKLLEAKGYKLIAADDYNMAFAKGNDDEPVIVPNSVDVVPLEIAFHVARKVGFNNYFDELHAQFPEIFPPDETDSPPKTLM